MKLKYILPLFVLTMFTGCLSEDDILKSILEDPVAIADGDYATECAVDGSDSSITHLNVSSDPRERSIQVEVFTGVTDCSNSGVLGTVETAAFVLSEYGFGNNTAYMTEGSAKIPYHVDPDGALYIGASEETSGEPADIFADFIDDPTNAGGTKFIPVPPSS